jgi:hypothetical protein
LFEHNSRYQLKYFVLFSETNFINGGKSGSMATQTSHLSKTSTQTDIKDDTKEKMISKEELVSDIKTPDMGSNLSSYIRCRLSYSTLISNFRNVLDPKNF